MSDFDGAVCGIDAKIAGYSDGFRRFRFNYRIEQRVCFRRSQFKPQQIFIKSPKETIRQIRPIAPIGIVLIGFKKLEGMSFSAKRLKAAIPPLHWLSYRPTGRHPVAYGLANWLTKMIEVRGGVQRSNDSRRQSSRRDPKIRNIGSSV
jgi:hypothetical protein